jgi:hypothetical protein
MASDVYREKNELLTSKQIIQYRENLDMSRLSFANYLKVGEASVKRWESFYIQESSQDNLIRVKCDLGEAERNYFYLLSRGEKPDIYNGMKKFSVDLFDNVASYLLNKISNAEQYLKKLHFYVDFLHFKKHEKSITGIKYVPLKAGPSPCLLNLFSREERELYNPRPYNPILFDDQELSTVETICRLCKDIGTENLLETSRKEKGFVETKESNFISYKYARDLLI